MTLQRPSNLAECQSSRILPFLATPFTLSQAQIDTFVYNGNARPVQDLDGGSVLVDQTAG